MQKETHAMKLTMMLVMVGLILSAATARAEFRIHPSIAVGEEYNDNVFDSRVNSKTDYITHTQPGLTAKYKTSILDWDLSYLFDYRYYAKNSQNGDYTNDLVTKGLVTIVDNLLFLDVNETYQRVSLDITKDYTKESLNFNQTNSNIVSASPYITLKPFSTVSTKLGYRYSNIWYQDPTTISKQLQEGYVNIDYEVLPKIFINSGYTYTHSDARQDPQINNYDQHTAFLGPRYEFAEKSYLYGQGGYTIIDYATGSSFKNPFWNVGLTHNFNTYVVSAETRVDYIQDPQQNLSQQTSYTGSLEKIFPRGNAVLSVGYIRYKDVKLDKVTTDTYSAGFKCGYQFLPKLSGKLDFIAEDYDYKGSGHTRRFYVNPYLSYDLGQNFVVSMNYIFVNYHSKQIYDDNRNLDRVMLDVQKTF
jgi:hypothetical protein